MNKTYSGYVICSYGGNYGTGDHDKQPVQAASSAVQSLAGIGAIAMAYIYCFK